MRLHDFVTLRVLQRWILQGPGAVLERAGERLAKRIITCLATAHAAMYRRLPPAVSLAQAADGSPTLARLAELARESGERLRTVETLIPAALRPSVHAGPVDGSAWCLLVDSPAAAAKLRQLLPAMQERLAQRGWQVQSIRLKIQSR